MKFDPLQYFDTHRVIFERINMDEIALGVRVIKSTFRSGGTIFTCGKGGSATTASHMITDWNKMVQHYTNRQFKGVSLCDNVGLLTAFANDLSYEDVFVGQLR